MIRNLVCKEVIEKNNELLKENKHLKEEIVVVKQKAQETVNKTNKYYKGKLRGLGIKVD